MHYNTLKVVQYKFQPSFNFNTKIYKKSLLNWPSPNYICKKLTITFVSNQLFPASSQAGKSFVLFRLILPRPWHTLRVDC